MFKFYRKLNWEIQEEGSIRKEKLYFINISIIIFDLFKNKCLRIIYELFQLFLIIHIHRYIEQIYEHISFFL